MLSATECKSHRGEGTPPAAAAASSLYCCRSSPRVTLRCLWPFDRASRGCCLACHSAADRAASVVGRPSNSCCSSSDPISTYVGMCSKRELVVGTRWVVVARRGHSSHGSFWYNRSNKMGAAKGGMLEAVTCPVQVIRTQSHPDARQTLSPTVHASLHPPIIHTSAAPPPIAAMRRASLRSC
jgi:hypothetical protein